MSEIKPCKVCECSRQKYHGVVVDSLKQLKLTGNQVLGFSANTSVSVVLDEDGTVVEDDAYFFCLPPETKFMLLRDKDMWKPARRFDGGTAWLMQSFDLGSDAVDSANVGGQHWRGLAQQLRQNLANIILMSEADLESLVDVPRADLASALSFPEQKTQHLQNTLQNVLDRREKERQSKELLQLYLKAVAGERSQDSQQGEAALDVVDATEVDSAVGFNARTLLVLKGKPSPETRLSNEELQMVLKQGVEPMMVVLGWNRDRTAVLLQACEEELTKRLKQVQAMQSLSAQSQSTSTTRPNNEKTKAKCRK